MVSLFFDEEVVNRRPRDDGRIWAYLMFIAALWKAENSAGRF